MASVVAPPRPRTPTGGGGPGGGDPGDRWRGGGGPDEASLSIRRYKMGMWIGLGAVVMMFAAFTSAYVVRKGLSNDWRAIELPPVLWLNTAVLAVSSLTFERARKNREKCLSWLGATSALGVAFLAGQYAAWRELRAAGVYLASNPSSSFFYLLTGTHAIHLFGGLLALLYIVWEAWRYRLGPAKRTLVEVTAIYWHFMDGLWIYILLLLWFWR